MKKSWNFILSIFLLIVTFLAIALTEWLGYHKAAVFLIKSVLLTLAALVITVCLCYLTNYFYKIVDNNQYALAKKLRKIFGIKPHKKSYEFLILKVVVYIIIFSLLALCLLKIWGMPNPLMRTVVQSIFMGFTLVGIEILPARLVFALILFPSILLIGRFIATYVARKNHFAGEEDTQIAIASLIFYLAFSISLLITLLVMGVNFTGLAIIAGALSVGIGLGLQGIVNNFVSGIILLLEKPVKPGDRVIIGSTEGFIKKIRIRSTQIKTLAKEDVIVPNSDLITNQITNYMFRDPHWRVVCKVGVIYGSDVELVKKVLLDVAVKHPDIIQDIPNQPIVLFYNFGDSSLNFELWCIIHDVNKKFIVASDLNFAIDKSFRQHKITIAFPQRDIHIKSQKQAQETHHDT